MISRIHIKNFKSIVDLTLDLGRVNLFIGENGSGKSNILEAVAFLSSYVNHGLPNNVLSSKGARTTDPEYYSSAFTDKIADIRLDYTIEDHLISIAFEFNAEDQVWRDKSSFRNSSDFDTFLKKYKAYIDYNPMDFISAYFEKNIFNDHIKISNSAPAEVKKEIVSRIKELDDYCNYRYANYLIDFVIYSPEASFLRKFEEEGQIRPLGPKGEGLFSLIKHMASENGSLQHIKEHLEAIDWFEDFSIPNDLMSTEYRIAIKDRFINSDLKYLDQRSANEGFLFLLFYIVLFSSKRTPRFFAIDNIEASFNPKLCAKLITMLVELAEKNEKQVLMTTHNPATLDGLDLKDPEQRLFVVRRNIDGHTIVTRIEEKPKVSAPMKLSEMWTKGFLGGLPEKDYCSIGTAYWQRIIFGSRT